MLNEDYREMLSLFIENKVEFLVVGAYAMGVYGFPRATGDIDLWINNSESNSEKVFESLKIFGAPLENLSQNDFTEKGTVFQIGVAPRRIDIITEIDGIEFTEAFEDKVIVEIEGLPVPIISRLKLLANKLASGRLKDKLDAEYLQNTEENDS